MATLTAATVSRTGVDVAGAAADVAGDEWANTGYEFVEVKNGSGSSINVTLDIQATLDGAAVTDPVVAVAAGATKIIGPFPKGIYNNSTTGRARIAYSAVTSVTTKVLKCVPG
jgi:hypothetical protein